MGMEIRRWKVAKETQASSSKDGNEPSPTEIEEFIDGWKQASRSNDRSAPTPTEIEEFIDACKELASPERSARTAPTTQVTASEVQHSREFTFGDSPDDGL